MTIIIAIIAFIAGAVTSARLACHKKRRIEELYRFHDLQRHHLRQQLMTSIRINQTLSQRCRDLEEVNTVIEEGK